jgi:mono/diheme cytochrome c family protein
MMQLKTSTANRSLYALVTIAMLTVPYYVRGADIASGKAKVTQLCVECHRQKDWNGETTAALESLINDVVAGKIKHPQRKLQLTQQDVADIAAYWTSGRK